MSELKWELNDDAIVAWAYVRETAQTCAVEASKDPNFVRFMVDLAVAYRQEGIAMLSVLHVLRELKYD